MGDEVNTSALFGNYKAVWDDNRVNGSNTAVREVKDSRISNQTNIRNSFLAES
jgi:hypothetical protein